MKKFLLAAASLVALTVSASAADMAARPMYAKAAPPVVAPVFTWTGFYIGGFIGGAWSDHSVTSGVPGVGFFDNNPFQSYGHNGAGFMGGGTVGYNFQVSSVVFGVEVEGGYLGASRTTVVPDTGDAGDQLNHKYSTYLVAAARLGLAFDRFLVYAKGGAAWAQISHTEGDLDLPGPALDPNFSYSVTRTLSGYAVGGGLEYAITNNWTIKGEYLYMKFGNFTATDAGARTYVLTNQVSTGKLGVNYKF